MSRVHLIVPLALLGLAACQTTDDPSKGGFLSGLQGLSSGSYQARVDDREKTLENEQDANVQQTRSLERAQQQSAAVRADRDAAEARFAAFNAELNAMRQRLAKAEAGNSQKIRDVAALNKEIDALEAKTRMVQQDSFTPDAERQKRLDSLKVERDALDREVEMLLRR